MAAFNEFPVLDHGYCSPFRVPVEPILTIERIA